MTFFLGFIATSFIILYSVTYQNIHNKSKYILMLKPDADGKRWNKLYVHWAWVAGIKPECAQLADSSYSISELVSQEGNYYLIEKKCVMF